MGTGRDTRSWARFGSNHNYRWRRSDATSRSRAVVVDPLEELVGARKALGSSMSDSGVREVIRDYLLGCG
jgi:hypothetical protein